MENATDALKMAAAVLIFVVALSISINAFGQARKTSQAIVEMRDREYDYTYVEDNGSTERIVGVESIIPTIYKAYKENYKIEFSTGIEGGIYQKYSANGTTEEVNTIDLENESHGTQVDDFIMLILYGKKNQTDKFNNFMTNNPKIRLNSTGLYDKIKEKKFKERLGVYYQEETSGATSSPDANKTKKRVITYEEV